MSEGASNDAQFVSFRCITCEKRGCSELPILYFAAFAFVAAPDVLTIFLLQAFYHVDHNDHCMILYTPFPPSFSYQDDEIFEKHVYTFVKNTVNSLRGQSEKKLLTMIWDMTHVSCML